MALLIPTASSFADSSPSEGARLDKKYILAQFRGDADFNWVDPLRSALSVDELKWGIVRDRRARLKSANRDLWKKVENGVAQATIVVIDPEPTVREIRLYAESEDMTEQDGLTDDWLAASCALTLIHRTPVAYLPWRLADAIHWSAVYEFGTLNDYMPEIILKKVGGDLRHAKIFAARAHAMFDLQNLDLQTSSTRDVFKSPLSRLLLTELLATARSFDVEDPKTIDILNQVGDHLGRIILPRGDSLNNSPAWPLVSEKNSRDYDEIQAADVAVGWAREMYDLNPDPRALATRFERVWINGTRIK